MTMHSILPVVLASLLLLQQIIRVESLVSPIQSADIGARRSNTAGRLRAPMMGRSLLSVSPSDNNDNDVNHLKNEVSSSSSNDEDDGLVFLGKRRNGVPLFGRRGMIGKRRGPLFG